MKYFAFLLALLVIPAKAEETVLSVCEIARIGETFDGKRVKVSGVLRTGFSAEILDELYDANCPEIVIRVVAAEALLLRPTLPARYKPDHLSIRRADRVFRKALAERRNLLVMIDGFLYTQEKEPTRTLKNGVILPPRHPWYPFVLLIQAVPKIEIR